MSLTYQNLVRGIHLVLFSCSSILYLLKPNTESYMVIAVLNLAGGVIFELVCNAKRPEAVDYSKEISALKEQNAQLEKNFQVIRDNISIASASGMVRR